MEETEAQRIRTSVSHLMANESVSSAEDTLNTQEDRMVHPMDLSQTLFSATPELSSRAHDRSRHGIARRSSALT